ncbi:MAG TPA: peptidoglycan-binding protein [Planctomycetota bacterium]|nr:peptidoglycan-binding protein [Planctomycetota bacterium]
MGKTHNVAEGDTLASIAEKYGFRSWRTIYDHPDNASLRSKRPNPMVLAAGDTVAIPDKRVREVVCETNKRHTFKLKALKVTVNLQLTNPDGVPYAKKKYRLVIDGKSYEGETTDDGHVIQEVPPSAKKGELTLWKSDTNTNDQITWNLSLGTLAPIDTNKGVKARLHNMGYDPGEVNDTIDDQAKEAIKHFQTDHGLEPKGELDDKTRKAIDEAYGKV